MTDQRRSKLQSSCVLGLSIFAGLVVRDLSRELPLLVQYALAGVAAGVGALVGLYVVGLVTRKRDG